MYFAGDGFRGKMATMADAVVSDLCREIYRNLVADRGRADTLARAHWRVWMCTLDDRKDAAWTFALDLHRERKQADLSLTEIENIDNMVLAEITSVGISRFCGSRHEMSDFTQVMISLSRDVLKLHMACEAETMAAEATGRRPRMPRVA